MSPAPLPPSPSRDGDQAQPGAAAEAAGATAAGPIHWPAWPWWIAPAGLVFGYMGGVVLELVALASGGSHPGPAATIAGNVLFDVGVVVAALWLVSRLGPIRPADFGYRRLALPALASAIAGAALVYYGVSFVYGLLVKLPNEKLPTEFGAGHSTAALVGTGVFVCAVAPMAEEFFFRGFLFAALRNLPLRVGRFEAGPWVAALLTGLLFGAAHLGSAPAADLVPLAFLGVVLCGVRARTGSLYPCMALHSANNALALGVNQLHWGAPAIVGLVLASWLVVGACTGALAVRPPRPA